MAKQGTFKDVGNKATGLCKLASLPHTHILTLSYSLCLFLSLYLPPSISLLSYLDRRKVGRRSSALAVPPIFRWRARIPLEPRLYCVGHPSFPSASTKSAVYSSGHTSRNCGNQVPHLHTALTLLPPVPIPVTLTTSNPYLPLSPTIHPLLHSFSHFCPSWFRR